MADIEWQPLPPLWPDPAVWTDVGNFTLLVFTQDDVPTWEVRRKTKTVDGSDADLIVCGTADTFDAGGRRRSSKQRRGPGNEDKFRLTALPLRTKEPKTRETIR